MKLKFKIILISLLIISCNNLDKNPIENLRYDSENQLKLRLNDPSSYEFISFSIDSIKLKVIKKLIKDTDYQLEYFRKDSLKNKEIISSLIDEKKSLENYFDKKEYILEFRTKNKFGALNIESVKVVSDKNLNFIEIKKED